MANNNHTEVIFGLYDDEEDLLRAVKAAKRDHLDIYDVFTPFPVHGPGYLPAIGPSFLVVNHTGLYLRLFPLHLK